MNVANEVVHICTLGVMILYRIQMMIPLYDLLTNTKKIYAQTILFT